MDTKFYICLHEPCPFETGKRKAIYTHLVRTHNERKEDYECEYCSTVFEDEALVEEHLVKCHPDQQFTYTCVSRIENVINQCAKLGANRDSVSDKSQLKANNSNDGGGNCTSESDAIKNGDSKNSKSAGSIRTKASVNESLNNLVARNQITNEGQTFVSQGNDVDVEEQSNQTQMISKPGGLKMKLNLKKIAECFPKISSEECSSSPPKLEPAYSPAEFDTDVACASPPDIIPFQGPDGVSIREKASKYFDRLEVYHTTDEHGRRCCPFCPYKTTKNTIRVHLSGIHKIYFVKCSLCEYKAAFPHQVTQHGVKFHKTTNLNVIQLSKESRERRIQQLNNAKNNDDVADSNQSYNYSLNSCSNENSADTEVFEEYLSDASSVISGEEEPEPEGTLDNSAHEQRTFKPPKSQMAKTDYFHIKVVNDIHLYCCNLCSFTTPVRATIYTHKYRHEEKTYKCDYCDFTAAPRSNVVHHVRTKHKNRAIFVSVVNDQNVAMETETGLMSEMPDLPDEIQEKIKTEDFSKGYMEPQSIISDNNQEQPTIIKVPQYKRTIPSVSGGNDVDQEGAVKRQKLESEDYKLSLNKLYKVNPSGSPKYVCVECSYGCDTHPKMKHHLYRHRPQQYKCPYCDHRKYPRSYVVRHVRDTHRDKPVRVIDLSVGPEPIDIPEYMEENDEDGGAPNESMDGMNVHDVSAGQDGPMVEQTTPEMGQSESPATTVGVKTDVEPNSGDNNCVQVKMEPEDTYPDEIEQDRLSDSLNSTTSIINNLNQTPTLTQNFLDDSNDVSPNFSEAVYTSTPLIESLINGKFPGSCTPEETKPVTKNNSVFRKKSMKEYRVNYGDGPKYICNICNYGTENYKTIHNHMYRHESQKFQCPYCGYRRSPKSFVENHIREVHRGHPLFVTELKEDLEHKVPLGSPRQCVMNLKKKEQTPQQCNAVNKRVEDELNLPNPSKLQIKWPAPKPASKINLTVPNVSGTPLQIPVRQKAPNAVVVPSLSLPPPGNRLFDNGTSASILPPNVAPFKPSSVANVVPRCATNGNGLNANLPAKTPPLNNQGPFKFKEPSRITYKTMYKCVFDPESCNHISKDKSKMKQHLFMHVEYKPWSCDLCDMTASQSSHIKNHVRTEHYGVSDMSFKYKKHNYLEKHIDTFLAKGLFTVPVVEYRMIMDMKGNTKASYRTTFARDSDGFVLCPHCDYKTKSASMTDHVKMKHMQPRFKCFWCNFKAFYRSEIRRHHKKEKTHANLIFKIQELDLKKVAEGFVEGNDSDASFGCTDHENSVDESCDSDEAADLDDDDDDDASSNEDLSAYIEYSTGKVNTSLVQKMTSSKMGLQNSLSNAKSEQVVGFLDADKLNDEYLVSSGKLHTEVKDNGTMKLDLTDFDTAINKPADAKFKCGYCSFSAALRVKVKMHCGKKHAGQELRVIEPIDSTLIEGHTKDNIMRINCSELKGTKIEADLKKAGVSKLNLASLFSSRVSSNRLSDDSYQGGSEESDDEDIVPEGHKLTIPFKKADESMKIDITLSKFSGNTSNHKSVDSDSKFKKPMDPISHNKFSEKKKDNNQKRKDGERFPITTKLEANITDEENNISVHSDKEIIVEPLVDSETDAIPDKPNETVDRISQNQCELQICDIKSMSNISNSNLQVTDDENARVNAHEKMTEIEPAFSIPSNEIIVVTGNKDCVGNTEDNSDNNIKENQMIENNLPEETESGDDGIGDIQTDISIPALDVIVDMNNENSTDENALKPEDSPERENSHNQDLENTHNTMKADEEIITHEIDAEQSEIQEGESQEGENSSNNTEEDNYELIHTPEHEDSEVMNDNSEAINDNANNIESMDCIEQNLVNSIIHKTFPRGSPVVLEMDSEEIDQIRCDEMDNEESELTKYDNNMDIDETTIDDKDSHKEEMGEMQEN